MSLIAEVIIKNEIAEILFDLKCIPRAGELLKFEKDDNTNLYKINNVVWVIGQNKIELKNPMGEPVSIIRESIQRIRLICEELN